LALIKALKRVLIVTKKKNYSCHVKKFKKRLVFVIPNIMLDPYNIDFKKLGFHAGLEVHHQIKSKRKLFCNCPLILDIRGNGRF